MYNAVVVFTKSKTTEYQIIQTLARGPKKQLHTFGKDKALSLSAPKIIPKLEAKCLLDYKYKRQWSL